jgi:hypothetical protein
MLLDLPVVAYMILIEALGFIFATFWRGDAEMFGERGLAT